MNVALLIFALGAGVSLYEGLRHWWHTVPLRDPWISYAVLAVFGVWAILSGLLQLYTGVRRWRSYGAQWAMILSGAQSALAGGFMIGKSLGSMPPSILDIAPYAAFGAFYFLVSAIWLTVSAYRQKASA